MGSTDSEAVPIPRCIPILPIEAPKDLVTVSFDEIKRIAHELARIRHLHHRIGKLHGQVVGLCERLAKQN